jgi:hypothetical protein
VALEKTPEYCLERAVECARMAEQSAFQENKAIFLDLAERWRALAHDRGKTSFNPIGQSATRPSLK